MEKTAQVTVLLNVASAGSADAAGKLLEVVYDDLRRLASSYLKNESNAQTLQATALVHEAYLRLVDWQNVSWQSRAQFFAVAAQVMRRILVDHARAKRAQKRDFGQKIAFDEAVSFAAQREVDMKGALRDYPEALKIYENLLTQNPDSHDLRTAYLKTKLELAEVYEQNYEFDTAASVEREIVAALERLAPNRLETRLFLATAYSQLGHSLSWDNKQPEAETEMAKATALADALAAENPNDTNVQQAVYKVYTLASIINETINDERSLQFANQAIRIAERAVERDAADMQARQNLAKIYSRLGTIFANLGRVPEAIAALEKAEKISLEILERDPTNRGYQQGLAVIYMYFGDAKYKQKDWQGALKAYQKTADYSEAFMKTDEKNLLGRRNLALALRSIGFTHLELGDKEKAKESFQRAIGLLNQLKAQNSLGAWDESMIDEIQGVLRREKLIED